MELLDFLKIGDEVFGKGNAAANDNSENLEGYKAGGRENSHTIALGGFQIRNGKEVNLELIMLEILEDSEMKKMEMVLEATVTEI